MKKNNLIITLGLLSFLVSCTTSQNNPTSNEGSISSVDQSSLSSISTTTSLPTTITPSTGGNISLPEQNKKIRYASHPLSEPDINKQLSSINPLGNMSEVWNHYRGDNILVAVIDSGFDYNHPDFKNMDGDSKISDTSAYIYTSGSSVKIQKGINNVGITDYDSHGTMCAGLLGASVNNYGITGIAPNVDLMLIKIDKKASSMNEAFKYAADNGARVISTSLGAYPNTNGESSGDIHFNAGVDLSTSFNEGINYAYSKGVSIVAATGNSKTTSVSYPAGCENVIGAGGLDLGSQTKIWDDGTEGSNYNGSYKYVDVFAPSEGIYAPGYDFSKNSSTYWSDGKGTSFAAPLIAGAIAMYYQKYPNHTNKDVEEALKRACINISSYNNNKDMGLGRLDVGKLLNIDEDVEKVNSRVSSTTINQDATKLTIIDEEGWNFRTLHLFNMKFEQGYGYYEFEKYLEYTYGKRIPTASYQLEGTVKGYAYTDEGYVGDYYVCLGNIANGVQTSYEYIFPWWVNGLSYQIVNNHNWMPEGGNSFAKNNGYKHEINSYFWYNSDSEFGLSQVVESSLYKAKMPAINVERILSKSASSPEVSNEKVSIHDYYTPPILVDSNYESGYWYLDEEKENKYYKTIPNNDIRLYGYFE